MKYNVTLILTLSFMLIILGVIIDMKASMNKYAKVINNHGEHIHILVGKDILKEVAQHKTKQDKFNACVKSLEEFDIETIEGYKVCIKLSNGGI